jgi:hypothetical protein
MQQPEGRAMSIKRGPRPASNFYVLNKRISEDRRLSWAARGLLVYLLGKPDSWEVSVTALINETAASGKQTRRDGMYNLLRELEAAGYLVRGQARGPGGTFDKGDYVVSELPHTAEPTTYTDEPYTDEPYTDEPIQVSTDLEQELKEDQGKGILATPKRPPVPVKEILDLYHQLLPMCPSVQKLTEARRRQIEARWRSGDIPDLESWREYFAYVAKSKFLTGAAPATNGRKPFVADIDFLIRESAAVKIYEGKYS